MKKNRFFFAFPTKKTAFFYKISGFCPSESHFLVIKMIFCYIF